MKTHEERVWDVMLKLLPDWKGTTKDLFELAHKLSYDYVLYINGELK